MMETFRLLEWAKGEHSRTLCKYNGLDFGFHLDCVIAQLDRFDFLLQDEEYDIAYRAACCHDLMEDARVSYRTLERQIGEKAADIVYKVSNEVAKSRAESFARTLPKIRGDKLATYVKLCDRIANVTFNLLTCNNHYSREYFEEYKEFKEILFIPEQTWGFEPIWEHLDLVVSKLHFKGKP